MAKSREITLALMRVALEAADPNLALRTQVRVQDKSILVRGRTVVENLDRFKRVHVFGAGKAACEMASAICSVGLGINGGLVITKHKHGRPSDVEVCRRHSIDIREASHPIPCEKGARATTEILERLRKLDDPSTLIIWLASGGGSALTGALGTRPWLDLKALREAMQWLLDSGADIEQVNTIRKHLCIAHGGRIAQAAGRSTVLTLACSDIIGSPLHAIAGGPTTCDPSTLEDCRSILTHLSATRKLAPVLERAFFNNTREALVEESPKILPQNVLPGVVVVDLDIAIQAASEACSKVLPQANVMILSSRFSGEASELARTLVKIGTDCSLKRPFVILGGGETTVTMDSTTSGLGGRNQEMALAAAVAMAKDQQCSRSLSFLAIGTDGTDGPTDAAGGLVTRKTISAQDLKKAEEYLQRHDSYNFFRSVAPRDHIKTGPTGTNVMDIFILCDSGANSAL